MMVHTYTHIYIPYVYTDIHTNILYIHTHVHMQEKKRFNSSNSSGQSPSLLFNYDLHI